MLIELDQVSKCYGSTTVFDRFSATIPDRSLLAVLGENGAGKTTLLRMLAGLAGNDKGDISFDGAPFFRDDIEQRRRLCFLPDFPTLFVERSTLENIAIYIKLWKVKQPEITDRIMRWLEELDLLEHANKPIALLSRGQAFKAALCALMAVDPELWLIDEPFASGMDPQGISMFKKYAREAVDRGHTVIYTTQLLELAESYSSNIWILHKGQLVANGTAAELKGQESSLESIFARLRLQ